MSDPVLRHPVTFWQWLTNQPGNLYTPAPPPLPPLPPVPKTALDVIDAQLARIHRELGTFNSIQGAQTKGYLALVASLDKLHEELVRRSTEESK